jgi:hypothetical protein
MPWGSPVNVSAPIVGAELKARTSQMALEAAHIDVRDVGIDVKWRPKRSARNPELDQRHAGDGNELAHGS